MCWGNQAQCICCAALSARKLKWHSASSNPSFLKMPVLLGLTAPAAPSGCSAGEGNTGGDGPYTQLPGSGESTIQEGMESLFWENSHQRASSEHWSQKAGDQIIEGSGKFPRTLGAGRNISLPA